MRQLGSKQKITLKRGNSNRALRKVIAFCGTRGLPANYGGFETAVDELTKRFLKAGYDCDVFSRRSSYENASKTDNGRKLVYIAGSQNHILDTFVSSIQTARLLKKNRQRYHHVFWFNNANLPGIMISALLRLSMSVNTDGLEWRRAKWSWLFKLYYIISTFLICRLCKNLISDSVGIQNYYRKMFYKNTSLVPYGVPEMIKVSDEKQAEILDQYGLEKNQYFLQITRIEPDNYPLEIAKAFTRSDLSARGLKMVTIGYKEDTPYALELKAYDGNAGVMIRPSVYDPEVVQTLRQNCFCYVHGNSVGGTNPALLEAMATCPRVLAIDCEFSREVLADTGMLFDRTDIAGDLLRVVNSEPQPERLKKSVAARYQWDAVAESYMRLAEKLPADYRPGVARDRVIEATAAVESIAETASHKTDRD